MFSQFVIGFLFLYGIFFKCRRFKYYCKSYPSFFSFMALSFDFMPGQTFSTRGQINIYLYVAFLVIWWLCGVWFDTDCSKLTAYISNRVHPTFACLAVLRLGTQARLEVVAREMWELSHLLLLPFRWSLPGRHLSMGPGLLLVNGRNEEGEGNSCSEIIWWKRYLTWLCFHLGGEGRWGGAQIYGELVSSFLLSMLDRNQGTGFQTWN